MDPPFWRALLDFIVRVVIICFKGGGGSSRLDSALRFHHLSERIFVRWVNVMGEAAVEVIRRKWMWGGYYDKCTG